MRHMWTKNQVENLVKTTKKDISSLVDSSGHNRFIEGTLSTSDITGVTFTYARWSLSGTHLMIVLGGTCANGSTLSNVTMCTLNLPSWIKNKIVNLFGSVVALNDTKAFDTDWLTQDINTYLFKNDDGSMGIYAFSTTEFSSDKNFRIQYDLLIDNQ